MSIEIDLSDKNAVVTGAAGGLGERMVRRLGQAGANIVLTDVDLSGTDELVEEVEDMGNEVLPIEADLTETDDVKGIVKETVEELGSINILVNNAGLNFTGDPLEQPIDEVEMMTKVNQTALFLLTREASKAMKDQEDGGSIVNISSVAASSGIPAMTTYGGTKGAVRSLTKNMAVRVAEYDVRVNSISPSTTLVERIEKLIEEKGDEIYNMDRLPLGRMAEPEEVADLVLFLASDLSSYITGENIMIDGAIECTTGFYKT